MTPSRGRTRGEIFVTPERVGTTAEEQTIVDVRRAGESEDGHVPGAVRVPFEAFRDPGDGMPGMLPTPSGFASLLSDAGIAPDDAVVAYDDDFGVYAARFLVTAEAFGHDRDLLFVLDGDFHRWADTFGTSCAAPTSQATEYACRRPSDGPLVTAADLEDALDRDAVIVDTRDPLEFETVHLPGAVNFQWRTLVSEDPRGLKPRDEVTAILADHGITPDRPVWLYCNTARRLSFVYALLRHLGYDDVAIFEGGIDAWADHGGKVETTT